MQPLTTSFEMESLIQDMIKAGVPEAMAREQYRLILRGGQFTQLHSSASVGNGILSVESEEVERLISVYDDRTPDVKILKFVPASGAATRMFKDLITLWQGGESTELTDEFFAKLESFPFADQLDLTKGKKEILEDLFSSDRLNLDDLPKGSIPFHIYQKEEIRTAFEEHLVEGVDYATSGGMVHIHFTISPDHMDQIKRDMAKWKSDYSSKLNCKFDLQFSVQLPSTDTVPFVDRNEPLRDDTGRVMTRPGGHGSLIHNLDQLQADIIFIKNIDNVVPDKHRTDTIRYKKALAGKLMEVRNEARRIISLLKADDNEATRAIARDFLKEMGTDLMTEVSTAELIRLMNRPYRVCGMVKNQGEPGGGPFWVQGADRVTLQIVESAQIDKDEPTHVAMLAEGTHFNPVDLVCSLNDLYGVKQNLHDFIDPDAAFVTTKNIKGQDAQVIEWPGLWNGAMADWNTVFVEVPISTFNPVKTVNDLLRPMHR